MSRSRPLILLALLTFSATASAAPVVMVQFGSFETQAEADKKLAEVKAANAAALGSLPLSVREVKLPPDNLSVYRTQAGPLASRADAQDLCSKISSAGGGDCYVVETALNPAPASAPAVASASPAPAAAATASAPSADVGTPAAQPPLAPLTSAAAAPVTPVDSSPAEPSPQLQAALDRAVAAQQAAQVKPSSPTPAPAAQRSFWSRINPFSDDEEDEAPAAPVAAAPAAAAAPALAVRAVPSEQPVVETVPVVESAPQPAPAPVKNVAVGAPVVASAAPLPTGALPADALHSVQVEEAQRVPLTQSNTANRPAAVSLLPSSTVGYKTLWAQLGEFDSTREALIFWDHYRQTHPDFPVVRVRIISRLQSAMRGDPKVWLRVGPFERTGFIHNLCSVIEADREDADDEDEDNPHPATVGPSRCGPIIDSGVATAIRTPTGYLQGSRYTR